MLKCNCIKGHFCQNTIQISQSGEGGTLIRVTKEAEKMTKIRRKVISALAAAAVALSSMGISAFAAEVVKTNTIPSSEESLKKESTLYLGEIMIDNKAVMNYIYSENISKSTTVFDNLKEVLPSPYSSMIPEISNNDTASGLLAYEYKTGFEPENSIDSVSDWTNAGTVAEELYPSAGVMGSTGDYDFYEYDSDFEAAINKQEASRKAGGVNTIPTNGRLVSLIGSSSSYSYSMIDGVLTKVNKTILEVEATTVKHTVASIDSGSGNDDTKETINAVDINVTLPKVGDKVTVEQKSDPNWGDYEEPDKFPEVTIGDGANYELDTAAYISNFPSKDSENYDKLFSGTFEEGKEYFMEISLWAGEGYVFEGNDKITVKVNGETANIEKGEYNGDGGEYYLFYVKFKPQSASAVTYSPDSKQVKWTKGGTDGVTIIFKRSVDDSKTFGLFKGVQLDSKAVDGANYTAAAGSLKLTLKADYLGTLKEGEHTVKAIFKDGEAEAKLVIETASSTKSGGEKKPVGDATVKGVGSGSSEAPEAQDTPPETGSSQGFGFMVTGTLVVLAAIAVVTKKQDEE